MLKYKDDFTLSDLLKLQLVYSSIAIQEILKLAEIEDQHWNTLRVIKKSLDGTIKFSFTKLQSLILSDDLYLISDVDTVKVTMEEFIIQLKRMRTDERIYEIAISESADKSIQDLTDIIFLVEKVTEV